MKHAALCILSMALAACGGSGGPNLQDVKQDSSARETIGGFDERPGDDLEMDAVSDFATDLPQLDSNTEACQPACDSRECGDDGCAGACGLCSDGKVCREGACICAPMDSRGCCGDSVCWFDSCSAQGEKVADCPYGCADGVCNACLPRCEGMQCGEDGCGKECGTCPTGKCNGLKWTPAQFCEAGTCTAGQLEDCDDANPCTVDKCDVNSGCGHTEAGDGFACITGSCDGQIWTLPTTCISGQCISGGGTEACGDANDCTDDTCSPALGCLNTPNSRACDDHDPCTTNDICQGGACLGTGTLSCDDQNPCTAENCVPGEGCTFSTINEGQPCFSGSCTGLSWTAPSLCVGGVCTSGGTASCDDGKSCTTDTCSPTTGCTNQPVAGKCLIGDACYEANQNAPSDLCRTCAPSATQTAWTNKPCDDGKPCTADSCNPTTGCTNVLAGGFCLINGTCHTEGQANPGNECQVCASSTSKTSWTSQTDGAQCAASSCLGQEFTAAKTCLSGSCQGGGARQTCDDGKSCTFDACTTQGCQYTIQNGYCLIGGTCRADGFTNPANSCQECASGTKQTAWTTKANGATCVGGSCSGLTWTKPLTCSAGNCTGGGGTQMCDDGLICTADACTPSGCTNTIYSGYCLINGVCYQTAKKNPDNPCQSCQPGTSTSAWTNATDGVQCAAASCSGLTLSLKKTCAAGQCVGATQSCDDGLACTSDSCSPTTGCANVLDTGRCLIDGVCFLNNRADPLNPCHVCSVTNSTSSWTSLANGTTCQNATCVGLTWTQKKTCSWGQCNVGGAVSSCDDGIACTTDTCSTTNGCSNDVDSGMCLIGGTCYSSGDKNPANPCQTCFSGTAWTNSTGGQCEPGYCSFQAYTAPKTCSSGQCSGGGATSSCVSTACSIASCDDAAGCLQAVQDGYCLIGGACYATGQENPSKNCQVCDPSKSKTTWSLKSGQCLIGGTCYSKGTTGTYPCQWCEPADYVSSWSVKPGFCLIPIDSVPTCVADGTTSPSTVCMGCVHATNWFDWSPMNEGAACLPPVPSATCHSGACY